MSETTISLILLVAVATVVFIVVLIKSGRFTRQGESGISAKDVAAVGIFGFFYGFFVLLKKIISSTIRFFRRPGWRRKTGIALLIFVALWVFGVFLQSKEEIQEVMIAYQANGPVLEFEIPEGIAPNVELLDAIVVWAGDRKKSTNVVFKFNGTFTESLVGGRLLTKYFGWLMPKKSKWATYKNGIKMIMREGSILQFNAPPYIIEVFPPIKTKTVSFAYNPIRYRITEKARP